MTDDEITALALANGFALKEQPDGSMKLHPYVFKFARALLEASNGVIIPIPSRPTLPMIRAAANTSHGPYVNGPLGYYQALLENALSVAPMPMPDGVVIADILNKAKKQ